MSGGHFDYKQYRISEIADAVEELIRGNTEYSDETIKEFRTGLGFLNKAAIYAQRIDWLVSGDDGEESFHRRLAEELGVQCDHDWVDATNKVVTGGFVCTKCLAVKAE